VLKQESEFHDPVDIIAQHSIWEMLRGLRACWSAAAVTAIVEQATIAHPIPARKDHCHHHMGSHMAQARCHD